MKLNKILIFGLIFVIFLFGISIFIDINFIHPYSIKITEIPATYLN